MAIQISGNTVIDNSRNLTCISTACGDSVAGNWVATQAEAEAGTDNTQVMTPLRVSQAIAALGGGMVDDDINWSTCNVGCTVRGGGNVIRKTGGVIWIISPTWPGAVAPWGMSDNGPNGQGASCTSTETGRSGWFVPNVVVLQCALCLQQYWNTTTTCNFWSSTPAGYCICYGGGFTTFQTRRNTGTFICGACANPDTINCVATMRVVCY